MKSLKVPLATSMLLALASQMAQAAPAEPASGTVVVQTNEKTWAYVTPVCMLGLQFMLVTQDKQRGNEAAGGAALVQVMQPAPTGSGSSPQPMTCAGQSTGAQAATKQKAPTPTK